MPANATQVRLSILEADLEIYVDMREGDARETLRHPGGAIDMVLLHSQATRNLLILHRLHAHIRSGGVVVANNVYMGKKAMQAYVAYVQNPVHGYRSITLDLQDGTEDSIKV